MKIAIIGASIGQVRLCQKAHELGLYTICFAWPDGAVCKDLVDRFYPVSIMDTSTIIKICRDEGVVGIVSNASELTAKIVSYVSQELGLIGIPYKNILTVKDKFKVRELTKNILGLDNPRYMIYSGQTPDFYPCVVKPIIGGGKCGVTFVNTIKDMDKAIAYCKKSSEEKILIEEFIEGKEISVESISFKGKHYVIQITDKENSGAPHFVEIGHHQPSSICNDIQNRIKLIIPQLLNAVGFDNGASHIELKINKRGQIYLIEINPRGGGDEISNSLVELSTDFDYVKAIIQVALGTFVPTVVNNVACSGIYFLCKQTENLKPLFLSENNTWLVERKCDLKKLNVSTSNRDRNGYLIYKYDTKITLDNY